MRIGGFGCSLLLLFAGTGTAAAAVTSSVVAGSLLVSSDAADAIAVTCTAGNVEVNGANPGTGVATCATVTQITVNGGPGANDINLSTVNASNFTTLTSVQISGGDGDDTLTGSRGADTLSGGPGDDTVSGSTGTDVALLGAGADVFVWNPGDGSDVVDGQADADVLRFNGANIGENISVSANGARARVFRDVGNVTMDLGTVERVEVNALGGADTIAVNPLAGSGATTVRVDLAAAGGVGDAQADTVNFNGGATADAINASGSPGQLAVTDGTANVLVLGAESATDRFNINGLAGNDTLSAELSAAGLMLLTVDGGVDSDTAVVTGTAGADAIQITGQVTSATVTAAGATLFSTLAMENLRIDAVGGNDTVSAGTGVSGLLLTLDGGPGDDILTGGNGVEQILGGDGSDTVRGGPGNDVVLLGANDDVFQWDPGDGSDVVEGQGGTDVLRFNGANINEIITVSANGTRTRLFRNVANITMDVDGVEQIEVRALGGTDALSVDDLSGTAITQVLFDLNASGGGGDGIADTVQVNGGPAGDSVVFSATGNQQQVGGLAASVSVIGAEPLLDGLTINGQGGDDLLTAQIAASAGIRLTLDGSINGSAGDLAVVLGESFSETFAITAVAANARVARSVPSAAGLDIVGAERLQLDTLGGADAVSTQFLASTRQLLDGGAPATYPGDTLSVPGLGSDASISPLGLLGFAPIFHTKFEFGVFEGFPTARQVTPPAASTGSGAGRVTLTPAGDGVTVSLAYSGLGSPSTQVHIHGPAPRGSSAPVILTLPSSGATSGSINTAVLAITPAQLGQLQSGLLYFDVHSTGFPNGEIRGQIDGVLFSDGFE